MSAAQKNVTLKILILLIATDFLETGVQFCFKKTSLGQLNVQIKNLPDLLTFAWNALLTPWLWLAFSGVLLIFVIWSTVLSRIDLSVAVPIASFSYIFVPLTSLFFLHETIPFVRWIGILFILFGVMLVSKSSSEQQEA